MNFHEVRFPASLSFGSVGGPERRTDIVTLGLDQDAQREGVDFEVDLATGRVMFSAPPPEQVEITAGFEFDVPVRFDTDKIQTSVASFQAGDVPNVPVVEVRV